MKDLISERISVLEKMLIEVIKQTKTSLFKEYKEIALITDKKEEQKDLFSLNVYLEAVLEFCEIKEKEEDKYKKYKFVDGQCNKTDIELKLLIKLFENQYVFENIVKKDDFLNGKIKKDLLKKAFLCLEDSVKQTIRNEDFSSNINNMIADIRKKFSKEYSSDGEKISEIAKEYKIPFYFFEHYLSKMTEKEFYVESFNDYIKINLNSIEKPKIYFSYYNPKILSYYQNFSTNGYAVPVGKIIMDDIIEQNNLQMSYRREKIIVEKMQEIEKNEQKSIKRKI